MSDQPEYRYRAYAEEVTDGDTVRLRVDLGFHVAISINGRVRGVNTPERGKPGYQSAKDYVRDLLQPAVLMADNPAKLPTQVIVQSYRGERSFERWIVDICLPDGTSLADRVISAGRGVPFDPKVDKWTR